jgi:nitrite reductase/ring-hydroxylating ferredoxin subunit
MTTDFTSPSPPPLISDGGWRFAGKTDPFRANKGHRAQLEIDKRFVVLMLRRRRSYSFSDDDDFVCFDATCYHMGAPLLHADIEDDVSSCFAEGNDANGRKSCVIVCPWHHYKIDVGLGGERVYYDAFTKERKTVARRQRTHEVRVDDEENVWVKLNGEEETYESDRYAFKQPLRSTRGGGGGNVVGNSNRYARTSGTEEGLSREFKSSGEAFNAMKGREGGDNLLGQMVGKSMSGGDGVAPWAISMKEAGGVKLPPPPPPARGILKKTSRLTSSSTSSKAKGERILEEEVFEDAKEETVAEDDL